MSSSQSEESHPPQPFPKFYVFRPDRRVVPLIAVDELPSWLQIGDWDWNDISLFGNMIPASWSQIPRKGEYDVVCYNCCSNVDALHRSISEQSDRPPSAASGHNDVKHFPGAFYPLGLEYWAAAHPMLASYFQFSALRQPPFYTHLQSPFVGMCLVDVRPPEIPANNTRLPSFLPLLPLEPTPTRSTDDSTSDQKPALNPEAAVFSPSATSEELPEPRTQIASNIIDSDESPEIVPRPAPCVTETKGDLDTSLPPQASGGPPRRNLDAAIAQLRRALGMVEGCTEGNEEIPEDDDVEMHDAASELDDVADKLLPPPPPKKKVRFLIPNAHYRRRRARRGGRRARVRRFANRMNTCDTPLAEQQNSSTKRRDRREKIIGKNRKNIPPGSRYWHMMRIPNWRAQVPA